MRQFFCRFLQMLSTAATIEVSVVYLQCSVPCHVNLLARTVFENICFPFFLRKLTSISRQNWSCEEIPSSQNSDKTAPFSAVVVNKNIASSVWKSTTVNHFAIKSRCLNTMKSFLTFKIINSGIYHTYDALITTFIRKNFTAVLNSSKKGRDFELLFRACALSSPVTFLTGNRLTCTNRIWPDLALGFVDKRSGYEISLGTKWSNTTSS